MGASAGPAPSLAERVLAGDARAVARAISFVEDEAPEAADLLSALFPNTGRAYLIGVTGPPGAGKSTLVDRLIAEVRARHQSVGVIAVDPTSPFTGGALLGDRVRMQAHAQDAGVFIRSMATRGHLGGLARATGEAASILDAAGRDVVIIETVGVGQDEVDIVGAADVSIVTLVPGTGDDVQALKAGLMEIADIFVVNKMDRDGADRMVANIESMLTLGSYGPDDWRPAIVKTQATTGAGVAAVLETVDRFRARSGDRQAERRRARGESRLRDLLARRFLTHVEDELLGSGEFKRIVDEIAARTLDPYTASRDLFLRALTARGPSTPDQA